MWEQQFFELFTTFIPQGFAFVLLFFSLAGIKIEKKSYSIFSVGIAIIIFLVRPYVDFGVHSVITLFIIIIVAMVWGKKNIFLSFIYGVLTFVVAYLSEWITFIILGAFKFDMKLLNTDPQIRIIIGAIPILIIFAIGLTTFFIKRNNRKNAEDI